ncbi:MAG TPA: hypothetical protein VFJ14_17185 [Nocardioidaceae bacterium]|nr:hypothetical protein [Nocardioidaceae bacterium]
MARTVYLHVGLPKSGTTYLQAVLGENKARLADRADVLYPGANWVAQVHAVRDVLAANPHGSRSAGTEGAWQRLVDEMAAWHGDAVVSMEWLGSADPDQARHVVASLAPAHVEVVVTVRDLARTLPAAWQEFVQNWEQWSWAEFLASVTSENPRGTPAGDLFWSQQDLGRLLAIWTDVLPPAQVHVVTLPRPGATAGELWTRFAQVLGIDGSGFDASGRGSNESLGLESAEVMLRLNTLSRTRGMDWPLYDEMFKHALAKRGLSKRKHQESSLLVPTEYEEWTRARSAEMVQAVESSGAQVTGDLGDLEPVFGVGGRQPDQLASADLLDAAVDGLVAVAQDRGRELETLRRRNGDLRERVRRLERLLDAQRQAAESPTLRASLVGLSERHGWAMTARRAYVVGKRALRRTQ